MEFKYLSLTVLGLTAEQVRTQTIEQLGQLAPVAEKLKEAGQQARDYV